jgi:hypothetical protein
MNELNFDYTGKPLKVAKFSELDTEKNQIDAMLQSRGIKYSAKLVGPTKRDKWECDAWRVSFVRGNAEMETDYFTGTGHRKSKTPNLKPGRFGYMAPSPVTPCAADVLYSLCLDAEAESESFQNWCDNFGYDSDSISALNTYQACERIARDLYRVFDRKTLAKFREVLQDY